MLPKIIPDDRYNLMFLGFSLLAMINVSPSVFFITANNYWSYKFRDVANTSNTTPTPFQVKFTSYFTIATTIPCVLMLCVNLYILNRVPTFKRFLLGIVCLIILYCFVIGLAYTNTDTWQENFFHLSIFMVFMMSCSSLLVGGANYELLSKFPPKYMTAVNLGESIGSISSSVLQLIALYIGSSPISSAIIFFSVGTFLTIMTFIFYLIILRTAYYKFHIDNAAKQIIIINYENRPKWEIFRCYWFIFKKIWKELLSNCIAFALTYSIYSGVTILYKTQYSGSVWGDKYFKPAAHYLMASIMGTIAKVVSGKIQKPENGTVMLILSILRILFIPLILLCNLEPHTKLGVWFDKDYQYLIIVYALMFSHGYFLNITTTQIMKIVSPKESSRALSLVTISETLATQISSSIDYVLIQWIDSGRK